MFFPFSRRGFLGALFAALFGRAVASAAASPEPASPPPPSGPGAALPQGTSFAYDAEGRACSSTEAPGAVTTSVYDAEGRLVSVIDPQGNVTTFRHDAPPEGPSDQAG
jgi:YD repeat-containing protein